MMFLTKHVQFVLWVFMAAVVLSTQSLGNAAAEMPDVLGRTFQARDTLQIIQQTEPRGTLNEASLNTDVQQVLEELSWQGVDFEVSCQRPLEWRYDCLIRFPSAGSTTDSEFERVAAEWHMARDEEGEIVAAPGLVVVHESGRSMAVGRAFAMLLSRAGLHTFLVQLPGYGVRRDPNRHSQPSDSVRLMRQAVQDVRRTRDAIACLPLVQHEHIGVQGTSLGGFVAATAAGLDGCFDSVFIMLAGGNVYEVIEKGDRDAAKVRERLAAEGLTGEKLKELLSKVEPLNVANRIDPKTAWLFSARQDQVVPLKNAIEWAKAVGLEPEHHVIIDADHYSGIVHLPTMVMKVRDVVLTGAGEPSQN